MNVQPSSDTASLERESHSHDKSPAGIPNVDRNNAYLALDELAKLHDLVRSLGSASRLNPRQ